MLVLSRKVTEEILIGDTIRVKVTRLTRNRVSLAIEAPQELSILRGECLDEPRALSLSQDAGFMQVVAATA